MDNLTSSEGGAGFLRSAEKKGEIENIGEEFDLPKSIVVTERDGVVRARLSPITTLTLWKRSRGAGDDLL